MKKAELQRQLAQLLEQGQGEDLELLELVLQAAGRRKQDQSILPPSHLRDILQYEEKSLGADSYQITIPITPFTRNIFGAVHGGIIATLLDTTMGYVLNHELVPKGKGVVTTEMKVNYLRAGDGEFLRCVASIVHRGGKLCVVEGKLHNDRDELIAIAMGTFYIFTQR